MREGAVMTSCLACGADASKQLQTVSAAEQHSYLAAGRKEIRKLLDQALPSSSQLYEMRKCGSCGLEFTSPPQAPDEGWYAHAYAALNLYPERRWEYSLVLNDAEPGQHFIDIGCGSGEFLRMCSERGHAALGLDFAEAAVRTCLEAGLDAQVIDLETGQINRHGPAPDHIVAFHVLEHLDRPASIFELARQVGVAGTRLWISVPSDRRPTRRFGQGDCLDQPPHHMTRWTPLALERIGVRHGWQLQRLAYEPLSVRGRLWSEATHTRVYRSLIGMPGSRPKWIERAVRWGLLPVSGARVLRTWHAMSGFSMTAQYEQVENG
jgi:SAM-dependent methyltransferase